MDYFVEVELTNGSFRTIFTDAGEEKLRELSAKHMPSAEIARKLNANVESVRTKLGSMKLRCTPSSPWDQDRVELLKKLWSEGLSASQCAARLGGITRNSVISKVHRLGLAGRATTSRIAGRKRAIKNARAPKPKYQHRRAFKGNPAFRALLERTPEPMIAEELFIPVKERKTIETLQECSCRWPIGDVGTPEFHFCGKQKVSGLSYCEFHARRAFRTVEPRRIAPAFEGRNETYVHTLDRVLEQVGSK